MTAPAPRVLLVAYQCGPGKGSVSQIGWEWYSRLARKAPVTLVTHVRNRQALVAAGAPIRRSQVLYVDTEWFAVPLLRLARHLFPRSEYPVFMVTALDYFLFDLVAVHRLRRRRGEWDVIHRVTPVTPSAPTRLTSIGLPTVIGPLNGGLPSAPAFPELMRREGMVLRHLREAPRLLDALWGSTRRASAILAATEFTRSRLASARPGVVRAMLENGVDPDLFRATPWPDPPSATNPLRVVFAGRLVPLKGVAMLLEALARLHARHPVRLEIVGDGPHRAELEGAVRSLGLGSSVAFLGQASMDRVAAAMHDGHVLCLPSVRESGGAVLLEAMASARPVIAVGFGGPAEIVDAEVGAAIPPDGREAVVRALETTLADVIAHPDTWRRRGEAGRARACQRFSWDAKVDAVLELYREVREAEGGGAAPR